MSTKTTKKTTTTRKSAAAKPKVEYTHGLIRRWISEKMQAAIIRLLKQGQELKLFVNEEDFRKELITNGFTLKKKDGTIIGKGVEYHCLVKTTKEGETFLVFEAAAPPTGLRKAEDIIADMNDEMLIAELKKRGLSIN